MVGGQPYTNHTHHTLFRVSITTITHRCMVCMVGEWLKGKHTPVYFLNFSYLLLKGVWVYGCFVFSVKNLIGTLTCLNEIVK